MEPRYCTVPCASRGLLCNSGVNASWRFGCRGSKRMRLARGVFPGFLTAGPSRRPRHPAHDAAPCHPLERAYDGEGPGNERRPIHRIWNHHNLKPHLIETFKLSRDNRFVEKLHDVVGLYLNPPDKALVLCVDEKSQIQALDRTQPLLPLRPGVPARQTHDYKRHGTTTLFAALSMLDGKVIGDCMPRHRHQEFIRFLKHIDAETSPDWLCI